MLPWDISKLKILIALISEVRLTIEIRIDKMLFISKNNRNLLLL